MNKKSCFLFSLVTLVFLMLSCKDNEETTIATNPFDIISESSNDARDKIVVISDLHLGNDLSYSETVAHLDRIAQLLNEVRTSATIKELILNGDILDEWYLSLIHISEPTRP